MSNSFCGIFTRIVDGDPDTWAPQSSLAHLPAQFLRPLAQLPRVGGTRAVGSVTPRTRGAARTSACALMCVELGRAVGPPLRTALETGCSSLRPSRNRPHSSSTISSSNPTACPSSGRDVDRSRARIVGEWSGYGMGGAGSAWGIELRNS